MLVCNELADSRGLDGLWEVSLGGHTRSVNVPGCWEAQGFDKSIDGPAVYRRSFQLPDAWNGRRVALQFDAVSYHAEIAVNGQVIGQHDGLWSPFAVLLPESLSTGESHDLTVTIYKPGEKYPMRETLAGFLPDVCTTFGGIWQPARLVVTDMPGFADLLLRADADSGVVELKANLVRLNGSAIAQFDVLDSTGAVIASTARQVQGSDDASIHLTLSVMDHELWQPQNPVLYSARLQLVQEDRVVYEVNRSFGFRKLARSRDQLLLNDTPICLRGLLHWGWYPELICPMPDAETIREEFRRARDMGYNMIKLCLWVPPPLYFDIADEEGMCLWLELPMWLPRVTPDFRLRAPVEYKDIMELVHHHPSIVIYSLGCELNRSVDAELLAKLDDIGRLYSADTLLCDNSGSGEAYGGLSTDLADFSDYHFYCDLQHFDPLIDHFRRDWQPARPWIFGEFCDNDDFRDPVEIRDAHGGEMPWWWLHENPIHGELRKMRRVQSERAAVTGWTNQAIQRTSRQTSNVIRKTIIEKVRRRIGMGGYVITSFRDTPVATSAPYDDLGRAKWAPEESCRYNSDSVLVLDQGRFRTWKHGGDQPRRHDLLNHVSGERVSLRLILAHTGEPLPSGDVRWWVEDQAGKTLVEHSMALPGPLSGGDPQQVAMIEFQAPGVSAAATLALHAQAEAGGKTIANRWPIWVYPVVEAWPSGVTAYDPAGCLEILDDLLPAVDAESPRVLVASTLPDDIDAYLRDGGRVLLLQPAGGALPAHPLPFWRESIKLLEDHPIMNAMPHEGFADLQFYSLATDHAFDAGALKTIAADMAVYPIMSRLDARLYSYAHYVVEGRLGHGRIIAAALRFHGGLGDQPHGLRDNPAGRYLLKRILDHLLAD
jgi:hypothetical protein